MTADDPIEHGSTLFIGVNYAPEPTGIAPYTTGMARRLVANGVDARVLTAYPHYPWWRVLDGYRGVTMSEVIDGVPVDRRRHFVPRRHTTLSRSLSEFVFGVRVLCARWGRPDVVVLVSPALISSRMAAARARWQRIPTVVWIQDIYTLGIRQTGGGGIAAKIVARIERGLANSASRVVVIHDRFRRMLQEDLDVTTPVDIVRNWSHIEPADRSESVRADLGWAPDDFIVLHAGNMGAKQGLENVVHGAREAERRGSRVRFVLLGDGNRRAQLEAMGGSDRLQFIDPLPDGLFERALASADALLVNELPGMTEMSVPSKLTSYFAAALPVIAAVDESSITFDEVRAAEAGVCVPADDAAALVDAAEHLAADPAQRCAYGAAGRQYRERHLTESAAVAAFARVLEDLQRPVGEPIAPTVGVSA